MVDIFRSSPLPLLVGLLLISPLSPAGGDDGRPASKPSADAVETLGPSKEEYKTRRRALMEKVNEAEAGARRSERRCSGPVRGPNRRPDRPAS